MEKKELTFIDATVNENDRLFIDPLFRIHTLEEVMEKNISVVPFRGKIKEIYENFQKENTKNEKAELNLPNSKNEPDFS